MNLSPAEWNRQALLEVQQKLPREIVPHSRVEPLSGVEQEPYLYLMLWRGFTLADLPDTAPLRVVSKDRWEQGWTYKLQAG